MKKDKKITLREEIEETLDEVVKLTTRNFGHPVPKVNREIFYKEAINATDKILQALRKRIVKKLEKMRLDIEAEQNDDVEPKVSLVDIFYFLDMTLDQINKELE